MIFRWCWARWLVLPMLCLSACQPLDRRVEALPAEPAAVIEAIAAPLPDIDWSGAGDCRAMLTPLKHGLDGGVIDGLDDTPFIMIGHGASTGLSGLSSHARPVAFGADTASDDREARCVLRIGQATDHQSDHRVLGQERVRSRYQSGTRSEKNPAYEVAKARLRKAEKAAKPSKSSVMKVGDPLLDLVGLLVGGALTGLGQWGTGDQVEEALDNLMQTPPSIDHPKYESYHFERTRIRASRAATIPIILTDRSLAHSWETSLKRRELRELFVVAGLDRQDEDFARHSEDSMTEDGLQRWLEEAPPLPIADIAAGLLDRSATVPFDRVAIGTPPARAGTPPQTVDTSPVLSNVLRAAKRDDEPFSGDVTLDAAALPPIPPAFVEDHQLSAAGDQVSRIGIIGESARAEGVFVAPHFILTPSDVVGQRGLVDVEDGPDHVALGLVAAVDRGLGLALVQAPLAGRPVAIGVAAPAGLARPISSASSIGAVASVPLLAGGKLVGFSTMTGPNIESDAIRIFLDRQRHLLPDDR